ncbi:MAG: cobalt-precorrin-6A reductase [Methylocystis sp.]|nr:cobalt-precorrin-6A reductase [Methylocystis sp.]
MRQAKARVLVLGGTSEARSLAARLAADRGFDATISLAGRTKAPLEQSLPVRIGGFGGVDGLTRYLVEERIDKVVDATHPFAARMSAHAAQACAAQGVPLICLSRAPWRRVDGDCWIEVENNAAAVAAIGARPRRIFLTTGRLGLADFKGAPQHFYLVRTIDAPATGDLPPCHELILARGPFTLELEIALMRQARIDLVVSKNSGGDSTYAKIAAARQLKIDVVMIAPPRRETMRIVHGVEETMAFLAGSPRI